MKTFAAVSAALIMTIAPVVAQEEAAAETTPTAAQAARAAQRKLDAERRAREAIEGKPVVYGGFLTEVKRAEKKSKLLSLRQPRDPKSDYKHVHLDERTERPKGFVLFSIGF
jgi:hypothetical protein